MSSLEDGFGGGVDDMVSANTGELRNIFWALPPVAQLCQFCSPCHSAILQMAQIVLLLSNCSTRPLLQHVAAATLSRSHVLRESWTFTIWWRITREPQPHSVSAYRLLRGSPARIGFKFWGPEPVGVGEMAYHSILAPPAD